MRACRTCGHGVDRYAPHCPNCGRPEPGKSGIGCFGLLMIGLLILVLMAMCGGLTQGEEPAPPTVPTAPAPAPPAPESVPDL